MHKHTLDYKMIVHESKLFQKKSVLLKSEKLFINVKAVKSLGKLSKKKNNENKDYHCCNLCRGRVVAYSKTKLLKQNN